MTAIFPGDIKTFTAVVDNFDVVEAANINPVYDEITSIETWLARALPIGYHSRTATMTTDTALTDTDYPIQYLNPTTDEFTLSLPSTTDTNHIYFIRNTHATADLAVMSGTDTIATVAAGQAAALVSNGALWSAISGGGSTITYATTISDVSDTTSSAGSSDTVARGDHTHMLNIGAGLEWSGATLTAPGSTDAGGHVIHDEGTPLTARANLDIVGDALTATDDAVNDKTIVTSTAPVKVTAVTKTVGSGKDYATIQGAIDYFKGKLVSGANTISIDAGTYNEALDITSIDLVGTLAINGDTRVLAGMRYVHGYAVGYTLTNGGVGAVTLSVGGAGNTVLTVACATTNPDFDADGWQAGDKVLVYKGTETNTFTEMTLTAVSNNTLTASGAWDAIGTAHAIVLRPSVIITPPSAVDGVTISKIRGVTLRGIYIDWDGVEKSGIVSNDGAVLYIRGITIASGATSAGFGIYNDQNSFISSYIGAVYYPVAVMGAGWGVLCMGTFTATYALVIKGAFYGFYTLGGYLTSDAAIAIKCDTSYMGNYAGLGRFTGSTSVGHVTDDYNPNANTVGNANSYLVA